MSHHGCFSGDCPHERETECRVAIEAYCDEMEKKYDRLSAEFRHWIDKATAAESEVQRLRAGLEKVKALEGMTLRCDPADYDFDAEDAFDGGAVNAFCHAADIAKDTLSPLNDCKHENKETESRPGCTYCLDCHARLEN